MKKIAWFTPLSEQSAIAKISVAVCEELKGSCIVDIWTACEGAQLETTLPVIPFKADGFDCHRLEEYDHVVYVMGNFAGFHLDIYKVMQERPGILLLHDRALNSLAVQMLSWQEYGGNPVGGPDAYLKLSDRYYGAVSMNSRDAYDGPNFEVEHFEAFPLIQQALEKNIGVFTHSEGFSRKIRDAFYGAVGFSYLPYLPPDDTAAPVTKEEDGRILVVSSGIVHHIKRTDKVVNVLLNHPDLAARIRFAVIGSCGGPLGDSLQAAADGPLKGCLLMMGYQPDGVLHDYLERADICINLRYPNSEACSYSLIEQMAHGKPVIVIDSGVYGEMPDDSVIKISLDDEERQLEEALRDLLANPRKREEIGGRAKNFVAENCNVSTYVTRFMGFLDSVENDFCDKPLIDGSIDHVNHVLRDLGFSEENLPETIGMIEKHYATFLRAKSAHPQPRVIGLWFGFPYPVDLRREGITRFLRSLTEAFLVNNDDMEFEIWAYAPNIEGIQAGFADVLSNPAYAERIKIITEDNWAEKLQLSKTVAKLQWNVSMERDNLADIARRYSKADRFISAILYLDNVLNIGKPVVLPAHDIVVCNHYRDFVTRDALYKSRIPAIISRTEHFARAGASIFCSSKHVRDTQFLKYIKNSNQKKCGMIPLPGEISIGDHGDLIPEREIREKFHIDGGYLFLPTQIRPYKNVATLVKAFEIVWGKHQSLSLVLTGNPADLPEVEDLIRNSACRHKIVCLSQGVSEKELISLYHYAAAVAVPTLEEGSFPFQASEALYFGAPVVVSRIPIVEEKIESLGLTPNSCGLELFNPMDERELAEKLAVLIKDRDAAIGKQKKFRDLFFAYTWKEAAQKYYDFFFSDPTEQCV